jgi:hypothetical protein
MADQEDSLTATTNITPVRRIPNTFFMGLASLSWAEDKTEI